MIVAPLFGAALVVAVATGPSTGPADETGPSAQKIAATEPLVRTATECIVRAVIADPRYRDGSRTGFGDLIVDSMPSCLTPVHAMIDAYDRYYGEGSGEAFFMGPYLDMLPKAVVAGAKKAAQ